MDANADARVSLQFIEEDDFDNFEVEEWGKEAMVQEDASKLWEDTWQIPNDSYVEAVKTAVVAYNKASEEAEAKAEAEKKSAEGAAQ